MLKVTGLPGGITRSELDQIFSDYEILTYEERIEEDGSISYIVELKDNENTARNELDRTVQIIRGERYVIRVDQFRGDGSKRPDPSNKRPDPSKKTSNNINDKVTNSVHKG